MLVQKDNNNVAEISTYYDNSNQTFQRKMKGGMTKQIIKPVVINKYNEFMGEVDLANQYNAAVLLGVQESGGENCSFSYWMLQLYIVMFYKTINEERLETACQTKMILPNNCQETSGRCPEYSKSEKWVAIIYR